MTAKVLDIRTKVNQEKFTVYFDGGIYDPYNSELWEVVNGFKSNKNKFKNLLTINQIAHAFASGQFGILSEFKLIGDKRKLTADAFVMTNIFTVDIDNNITSNNEIDPVEVFRKSDAQAMFYSKSHGIEKGNSYKLIYVLDDYVDNLFILRRIVQFVIDDLYSQTGVKADNQAFNFQMPVRGGNPKYEPLIKETLDKLPTKPYIIKAEQEQKQREKEYASRIESIEKEFRKYPFEAYKEAAETIGYIPSGGTYDYWSRLVLSIKDGVNTGLFSYEEGLELFNIISGRESEEQKFDYFRPRGKADRGLTMASFIYEAQKVGFKLGKYREERPSYSDVEPLPAEYEESIVEIDDYISTQLAKSILEQEGRILIESPTGSGKTTAFINAMKECINNINDTKTIYILTVPTTALVDQNSTQHKVLGVKGGKRDLFNPHGEIVRNVEKNDRLFITTWDKLPETVSVLRKQFTDLRFKIVVDEIHKFVTDYKSNYRRKPIALLESVGKRDDTVTYIGLSGTPEEIYKNDFDQVIRFKKSDEKSPAEDIYAVRFDKEKNELPELIEMIKSFVKIYKCKLLVFIQSKPAIETVSTVLNKEGIKTVGITSESKNNVVYKQIIDAESVPDDVDVILSTTVLAEGINIKNDTDKWITVSVSSPKRSRLFNLPTIRQMSNRLRNSYKMHIVFLLESKEEKEETTYTPKLPFSLEGAYAHKLQRSRDTVKDINDFIESVPSKYFTGVIENSRGLYLSKDGIVKIDHTYLRHHIVEIREKYFTLYRESFLYELEKVFDREIIKTTTDKFLEFINNGTNPDTTKTRELTKEIEEKIKLSEKEKAENIRNTFEFKVYDAFQRKDVEIIEQFKEHAVPRHIKAIQVMSNLFSYDTCYLTVVNIKRDADIYKLVNEVRYLREFGYYELFQTRTKTWKAIRMLLEKLGDYTPNDEYRSTKSKIQKKLKLDSTEINKAEKMLQVETKRTKKTRMSKVRRRTIGDILNYYNQRWYAYDIIKSLCEAPVPKDYYEEYIQARKDELRGTSINLDKLIKDEFTVQETEDEIILTEKCCTRVSNHELSIDELFLAMRIMTDNEIRNKREKQRIYKVINTFEEDYEEYKKNR